MSLCYYVIMSLCYYVIMLLCHYVIMCPRGRGSMAVGCSLAVIGTEGPVKRSKRNLLLLLLCYYVFIPARHGHEPRERREVRVVRAHREGVVVHAHAGGPCRTGGPRQRAREVQHRTHHGRVRVCLRRHQRYLRLYTLLMESGVLSASLLAVTGTGGPAK